MRRIDRNGTSPPTRSMTASSGINHVFEAQRLIIDDLVCAERAEQIVIVRGTDGNDMGAARLRKLDANVPVPPTPPGREHDVRRAPPRRATSSVASHAVGAARGTAAAMPSDLLSGTRSTITAVAVTYSA